MNITYQKIIRLFTVVIFSVIQSGCHVQFVGNKESQLDRFYGLREIRIPTIDISQDTSRHTIISNSAYSRQGHASTILIPDNNTIFATK